MFGYLVLFMVGLMPLNTIIERLVADGSNGIWNGNTRKATATREPLVADGSHLVGDGHSRQATAAIKRAVADDAHLVGDGHTRKATAVLERSFADGGHRIRDGHTRKASAATERTIINSCDRVSRAIICHSRGYSYIASIIRITITIIIILISDNCAGAANGVINAVNGYVSMGGCCRTE